MLWKYEKAYLIEKNFFVCYYVQGSSKVRTEAEILDCVYSNASY